MKGISCVLAAVNQTSDDFLLFKKAQNDLKLFEYYRKKDKFASFQNLQSKDFVRASRFHLIDGSKNTENETSREQRRSRNSENRCNNESFAFIYFVLNVTFRDAVIQPYLGKGLLAYYRDNVDHLLKEYPLSFHAKNMHFLCALIH